MTPDSTVDLIRQSLMTGFWIALPLLVVGFAAGIVISLLQIVTSIQDSAFGTVPRPAASLAAFLLLAPWMLLRLIGYTTSLFGDLGRFAS